jgi:hypothetical protein
MLHGYVCSGWEVEKVKDQNQRSHAIKAHKSSCMSSLASSSTNLSSRATTFVAQSKAHFLLSLHPPLPPRPISPSAMKKQAGATQSQSQTLAAQKQDEQVHAVLDLSCFDWLNFPHWSKVCRG